MSPLEIGNAKLYHDRTVQDWHRKRFPRTHDAIDLDLCGVCHVCRRTLYLIEATTNPDKPTTIIRHLAEDITTREVPAFLVLHDTTSVTSARQVYPMRWTWLTEPQFAQTLSGIRAIHMKEQHQAQVVA